MENKTMAYPKTGPILALVGSTLILVCGLLLTWVSSVILPRIDFTSFPNFQTPQGLAPGSVPAIASGVVGSVGVFGLVTGAVVLAAAVLVLAAPAQAKTWGVLMVVFSALSFLGFGGFIVGAVLGIVGGALTLRWHPATA